jgi:hypothetical protein
MIGMAVIFMTCSLWADDQPTLRIPGIDFSKPGPVASPSSSPSVQMPGGGARPRRHSASLSSPNVGVGASGNNQGYSEGQGKLKFGF